MKLSLPIKGITNPIAPMPGAIWISQKFGVKWISDRDQTISGKVIKKGDDVYLKLFGYIGHNGIDIAAPKGTPVYAPCDGYVVEANGGVGYGNRVILLSEEDGVQYLQVFGHLDNWNPLPKIDYNLKSQKHPVKRGDKIGEVDSTGFSNGHHLHWGLYKCKNYIKQDINNGYQGAIDPMPFTKGFMNQAKVVKSKVDGSIYVAYEMPSMEYLKTKADLEGFEIPNPIPDTDSLK